MLMRNGSVINYGNSNNIMYVLWYHLSAFISLQVYSVWVNAFPNDMSWNLSWHLLEICSH